MESILEKWDNAREKLKILEDKIEKYKASVIKELNSQGIETISTDKYKVSRRRNTKTYLSKEKVPKEIWEKYSSRTSYDVLFLSKKP